MNALCCKTHARTHACARTHAHARTQTNKHIQTHTRASKQTNTHTHYCLFVTSINHFILLVSLIIFACIYPNASKDRPPPLSPLKSRVFNERSALSMQYGTAKLIIITNQTEMFFIHSSSRGQNISERIIKILNNNVEVIFYVIDQCIHAPLGNKNKRLPFFEIIKLLK